MSSTVTSTVTSTVLCQYCSELIVSAYCCIAPRKSFPYLCSDGEYIAFCVKCIERDVFTGKNLEIYEGFDALETLSKIFNKCFLWGDPLQGLKNFEKVIALFLAWCLQTIECDGTESPYRKKIMNMLTQRDVIEHFERVRRMFEAEHAQARREYDSNRVVVRRGITVRLVECRKWIEKLQNKTKLLDNYSRLYEELQKESRQIGALQVHDVTPQSIRLLIERYSNLVTDLKRVGAHIKRKYNYDPYCIEKHKRISHSNQQNYIGAMKAMARLQKELETEELDPYRIAVVTCIRSISILDDMIKQAKERVNVNSTLFNFKQIVVKAPCLTTKGADKMVDDIFNILGVLASQTGVEEVD